MSRYFKWQHVNTVNRLVVLVHADIQSKSETLNFHNKVHSLTVLGMNWCFFPPLLALGVRSLAEKSETGVLGGSLAASDWSVVVVSPHAGATVEVITCW